MRENDKIKLPTIREIQRAREPPSGHGLFTVKGVEWLRSLKLEPVDCHLGLIEPLEEEVRVLSSRLKREARAR